ncbi:hypothetical protein AW736_13020, partial [Termitidicoccus mucosus]
MNIALHALRLPVAALLASVLSAPALRAQVSGTFTGSGTNWADAANWSPAAVPDNSGDAATFNVTSNTSLANKTVTLGGAGQQRTLGALTIVGGPSVNASGTLTLGAAGQVLRFDNGPADALLSLSGGVSLRLLADVSAAGNLAIQNDSGMVGSITLAGDTAVTGTALFSNADPYAAITVSGPFSAAALSKDGAGRLVLNSAATIAGPVNFNNGTLVIGADNALGSGTLVLAGSGARRINLANATGRTLANAIDLSSIDLAVGREDQATATTTGTLTLNPAAAALSSIGAGQRAITVDALTSLVFGANQSFSGAGTLVKQGGGVLTLGGAQSTFAALDVRLGAVRGSLSGDMTLGSGPSIFGAGNITVDGGNTILEVTSSNPAATLTLGAGAAITLSNYATFRLTNATLALLDGAIDLGGTGILDYGSGSVILGSTQILNAPAAGFNFGANLVFTDATGIAANSAHRFNLTGAGAQTLSYDTRYGSALAGAITVNAAIVKTGSGVTSLDSSITTLSLANTLRLDAGVFDLGATSSLDAAGGVSIGAGSLSLGKTGQLAGALAFDGASTGYVRLNGYSQTLSGVAVGAGTLARIQLGGDIATATTLDLGALSFADTAGILGIYGYLPGASTDRVLLAASPTAGQLANQVWFHGYNPGATWASGELLIPMLPDGITPDFLQAEWTGGANTLDASDYRNWRVSGTDIVHPFALPNAPGAIAILGDAGGSLGGKTVAGAGFASVSGTWTLGKLAMNNNPGGSAYGVNVGTLLMDSGRAGVPAVIAINNYSWNTLSGNIRLASDLSIEGGANIYFNPAITGTHDIIINRNGGAPTSLVENRFGGVNTGWTGNLIVNGGRISRQNNNAWGDITSAALLSGSINTITFNGGGIRGMANNNKISVPNRIFIRNDFAANNTTFTWDGDILLDASAKTSGTYTINVDESTVSPVGVRASLTFSASTHLVGDAGLVFMGSHTKEILSGSNTFSGGLGVNGGTLYTTVGAGGLTIGRLDAGNNYLGIGDITVTSGQLYVDTQGNDTRIGGAAPAAPVNLNLGNNQTLFFAGGGTVFFGADSFAKSIASGGGIFKVSGDLVLDGGVFGDGGVTAAQNINLYFDTTTNPAGQSFITKGAGGGGIVSGINTIHKQGPGQTTLDSALTFKPAGSIHLDGGVLQLTADNQVVQYSGATAPGVVLNGGALAVEHTSQDLGLLYLRAGGGSLLLGADGRLTFAGAASGTANWSTADILSIQNTSGVWNTDGTGAYVRFAADPNLPALDNIALTGYEAGVQVVTDGGYWYLKNAATAVATIEWTGGPGATGTLWSAGAGWLNTAAPGQAPNGIDVSVSIKDIDSSLATKTIDVDGNFTLSRLNVLSAQPSVKLGGSGTLIFDKNTYDARLLHAGGSVLAINNAVKLDTDIELAATVPVATGYLDWRGAVGGDGGITKTGAGTLLLSSGNTYSGGFTWRDSSVIQLYGANAAVSGSGYFGTGTLVIGDGADKRFYLETYNEQLASGAVDSAATSRTIASDVILRGHLYHQRQTALGAVVANTAGAVSTLTFAGNVFVDDLGTGATWIIDNYGNNNSSPYVTTVFNGNLSGAGNINQTGYGRVYYNGDNSAFTGNYRLASKVYVKYDNPFGTTGTLTIAGAINSSFIQANNGSATISIPNVLNITSGNNYNGNLLFNLDSGSTGRKSTVSAGQQGLGGSGGTLTFGKDHVIAGAGGFFTGAESSWSRSGAIRFLGANEFAGGITHHSSIVQVGHDSVWAGGTLAGGALGTGTLRFLKNSAVFGAYVGADSVDPSATSIRVSNPVLFDANGITITNAGSATTLILDTGSIALRNGKADMTFNITNAGQTLRVDSLLHDKNASTAGGITKTGAGVLELTNVDNQITDGIEVQTGTVRYTAAATADDIQVGSGVAGDTAFGTGTLTTNGASSAFQVVAADSGTVTIAGGDRLLLNNNGRFIVSGSDVTTVLAHNGALLSTSAAGQQGVLVADRVKTAGNYTLGVKLAAQNWELGAGTVNLAAANLLDATGTITLGAGATLAINQNTQALSSLLVTGDAFIDVAGGTPSNPVTLLLGDIRVNAGSLLAFTGWNGDQQTGLGSTIIQSTLAVGRVIDNVTLDGLVNSVRVWRNNNGDRVLLPYDANYTWSGSNHDSVWGVNNWFTNVSPLTHSAIKQPGIAGDSAIFDTAYASLAGADTTITVLADKTLGRFKFTGAGSGTLAFNTGGGSLKLQTVDNITPGNTSEISNESGLDVVFNLPVMLGFDGVSVGENLDIVQNGPGRTIFNSAISGPASSVSVQGSGTGAVVFNARNTFSGSFTLASGNIWLGVDGDAAGGPLGYGRIAFQSGTVRGVQSSGGGYTDSQRTLERDYILDGGFALTGTGALGLHGNGTLLADSALTVADAAGLLTLGTSAHALAVAGDRTLTTDGPGAVRIAGVALPGSLAISTLGTGTTTIAGQIAGTGTLSKTGSGVLALAGGNTFSGGATLSGGVTAIGDNAALGTGTATLDSGTLRLDANGLALANALALAGQGTLDTQANSGTLAGAISGAGLLAKAGSGTLTLTAGNSHTGTTAVNAGALVARDADALGASALHAALGASAVLDFSGTFDNAVAGAGHVLVHGASVRIDNADNSAFTGTWTVAQDAGALINDAADLGANARVALAAGGTLATDGAANMTFNNALTGDGALKLGGSGTHALGAGVGAAFAGTVEAASGRFIWDANASAALASATLAATGGLTDIAAGAQTAKTLALGGGTLAFTGTATVTGLAIAAGGSTAVLLDQAKLNGRPLLQQDEAVNETLVIASNWTGALADLRLVDAAGATLGTTSTLAIGSGTEALGLYSNTLARAGNNLTLGHGLQEIQLQAGKTLVLDGDATAPSGGAELHALISGSGNLQISATGAVTLNTAETYTGTTTTATGTLRAGVADVIAASAALVNNAVFDTASLHQTLQNLTGSGTVLFGGGTLTVRSGSYAGVLSGAATVLDKTTEGLLILSASNAYSGTTVVGAGTLRATHLGALGSSLASVSSLASLELAGLSGTLTNALAGTGTLRVAGSADLDYRGGASGWAGVTRIDSGRLRVNTVLGT